MICHEEGHCSAKPTLFESYSKCIIWIFEFCHFSPIFVLLKLTCLVTLIDCKLQVFKNSPKCTIFGIFNQLLSTQNVNVARFARNVEWDFFLWFSNTVAESSATEKHNCVIKKSGSSRKSRASRKFSMFSSWKAFMNAFAKGQNEWRRRPFCWPSYDVIKHMCSIIISINRVKENCVKSFESFILVRNRGFEPHRGKLFFVTRSFGPQWTSVI